MKQIKIGYRIKINKGKYVGKEIFIEVYLDEFEYNSLVSVLLERDYLECWCNNDEFEVISRYII